MLTSILLSIIVLLLFRPAHKSAQAILQESL